ncbi:FitA-like ribbon-helix-helix domain-containing protein [Candidatus Palauibacter sp.]|uniref:FitA-like ribbon-helix-helix domain-containing protein n=1 Tax=Candidatus Palauibacter sp. TaxID=3101350 RepID=UPI003C6F28A5
MSIQITIRGVPEEVRDQLKVRAASRGQSMQEYLRGELERMVAKPTLDEWLRKVRLRKQASTNLVTTENILQARDADRK